MIRPRVRCHRCGLREPFRFLLGWIPVCMDCACGNRREVRARPLVPRERIGLWKTVEEMFLEVELILIARGAL